VRKVVCLPLLFFATIIVFAQSTETLIAWNQSKEAAIDSALNVFVGGQNIAGLSVAILQDSNVLFAKGYGYEKLNTDKVSPNSIFRIASLTKQVTAAAIARLVEKGVLRWQDRLDSILPEFITTEAGAVTIHHLLNHSSGIKPLSSIVEWKTVRKTNAGREEIIKLIKSQPLDFIPGEKGEYNDAAYYLLGVIIEKLSGKPYAEFLQEELFQHLKLTNMFYCTASTSAATIGYTKKQSSLIPAPFYDLESPFSAAGLCASAIDFARWQHALHTHKILRPETLHRMLSPTIFNNGNTSSYGYGLFVSRLQDHKRISHGGGIEGYSSYASYYPKHKLSIVLLVNTDEVNLNPLEKILATLVLDANKGHSLNRVINH
jgi:D-alanyl-D-alanine carboxypeptidase